MKIIIPMSGMGQRFVDAGYRDPKPLIEIGGMPIIEHVVKLFPGERDFIFICNSKHLRETNMRSVLSRIAPGGRIVEIPPHKKGPVYAVSLVYDLIDDGEEAVVNYCDFGKYWDYADFLQHTRGRGADGAIAAYRGFHPHMLGTTNYAFMRDRRQWMLEIQEKKPFTENRMGEFASDGTYYFRSGAILKKYFEQLMDDDINLNGEYYVSMVYNLLARDGLNVSIYKIQHMLQWGTPQDVKEFMAWSGYFEHCIRQRPAVPVEPGSVMVIPMAGRGSRFANEGYRIPKPLIEVSGKPMVIQAAASLPPAEHSRFICLAEHLDGFPIADEIRRAYPDARIVPLDRVTEGQACTVEIGIEDCDPESPLVIGASDNGMLWDVARYQSLIADPSVDGIIFTFRHHASAAANPHMYGWVRTDSGGAVSGVSVKKAISDDPCRDHAVVGAFYFRRARYFREGLARLYRDNIRVNNEFYVDSVMDMLPAMGYRIMAFEVDDYLCWGTPDDLRTFEYWQGFFHKCDWHPYRLELDSGMNPDRVAELDARYRAFTQEYE
ncbi:MAG TPA: NTP transferase domain-containing protein [Spirochaetota bacterium]|nr:NTP transferase domain-containing protein [Spirochaetota bacterium]HNT11681.1 NTP transferase domain-containing protein [Spirochaetota bacterium]